MNHVACTTPHRGVLASRVNNVYFCVCGIAGAILVLYPLCQHIHYLKRPCASGRDVKGRIIKKFQKPIDKLGNVLYNINIKKRLAEIFPYLCKPEHTNPKTARTFAPWDYYSIIFLGCQYLYFNAPVGLVV